MGEQRQRKRTVPAAYIRGGTSKALFFHDKDLPAPGLQRDRLLKRFMGTPDPLQIDGMGGTRIVTAKIAIVRKSTHPEADVDYTFAQCGVGDDYISYAANCGNISSGVGPFAIEEGLIEKFRDGVSTNPRIKAQEVRIFNTNTSKVLIAHIAIDEDGQPIEEGEVSIAGVPGTGAPILMDYRGTVGATQGKGMLPTGNKIDSLSIGGEDVELTICDVANPIIFAKANDFGITGHEDSANLTANPIFIERAKELRGKAAQLLGMCKDWKLVDEQSPFIPATAFISDSADANGHLSSRLTLSNTCHESMAGTVAICTAACSRIPGSLVYKQIGKKDLSDAELRISHPIGVMQVFIKTTKDMATTIDLPEFETLSFVRTARRIMDGQLYIPKGFEFDNVANGTKDVVNGNISRHVNKSSRKVNGTEAIGNTRAQASGKTAEKEIPPLTEIYADFVSTTRFEDLGAPIVEKLKELLVDFIGVTAAGATRSESTESIINGLIALGAANGTSTVFTKGANFTPPYAALLNAALGHSLDFDDTYAPGALHPGVTTISVALTQAELSNASGKLLLTALAVGYEVICRLGHELGFQAYDRGFHNTATAGIFGAVAAIASIKKLPSKVVAAAFGLAGSKAAGSMQYLENGSWNKRLHPGFAAHDAFVSVVLAEAGVIGATKIFEGKFGFFSAYTPNTTVDWEWLSQGLGSTWNFLDTAIKPFPACRMTHGLIEIAGRLGSTNRSRRVRSIEVALKPALIPIVGEPTPNKTHPKNVVDAQFSAYYQTAVAWLDGSATGWNVYDRIQDKDVHDLLDKIACIPDDSLSQFGCRLVVTFEDGTKMEETLLEPLGEASNPFSREKVNVKYAGLAQPVYGEKQATQIMSLVDGIESINMRDLLTLLE